MAATASSAISRAVLFGGRNGAQAVNQFPSHQLTEDPFSQVEGYGQTLRLPPFSLEQLAILNEAQPAHEAALNQKTLDIVGQGPQFVPPGQEKPLHRAGKSDQSGEALELQSWWESLGDEYTILEILQTAVNDYKTIGWGFLEIARDLDGIVRQVYYVPAHTIRAHSDGLRFCQSRNGRMRWFKKWGTQQSYYMDGGDPCPPTASPMLQANELLPFRNPNRRSTWYNPPDYLSGIGWITLGGAARDWNILFFENFREPRHLIVITGLSEHVEHVIETLTEALAEAAQDPGRNILLPIESNGDAHVTIQKMSINEDMNFEKLTDKADAETLIAHRMPPDRIGIVRAPGFMAGSTSQTVNVVNQIYKQGVVGRDQQMLMDRLDRFIKIEGAKAIGHAVTYHIGLTELDISDEAADTNIVVMLVKNNLLTLNEGRIRLGEAERPEYGDMTYMEYLISIGVAGQSAGTLASASSGGGRGSTGSSGLETAGMFGIPPMPALAPGGRQGTTPGVAGSRQPAAARPEQMQTGEPFPGRPGNPTQPHNSLDHTAFGKSADFWLDAETLPGMDIDSSVAAYVERRLAVNNEVLLEELLTASGSSRRRAG